MGKIAADQKTNRDAVIAVLTETNKRAEKVGLYADAFIEYQEAQVKIARDGTIVADPRTGAPTPNPYLSVRDKAFARLEQLHKTGVKAGDLW